MEKKGIHNLFLFLLKILQLYISMQADKMKIKEEPVQSPAVTKKVKLQDSPPKSEIKVTTL